MMWQIIFPIALCTFGVVAAVAAGASSDEQANMPRGAGVVAILTAGIFFVLQAILWMQFGRALILHGS